MPYQISTSHPWCIKATPGGDHGSVQRTSGLGWWELYLNIFRISSFSWSRSHNFQKSWCFLGNWFLFYRVDHLFIYYIKLSLFCGAKNYQVAKAWHWHILAHDMRIPYFGYQRHEMTQDFLTTAQLTCVNRAQSLFAWSHIHYIQENLIWNYMQYVFMFCYTTLHQLWSPRVHSKWCNTALWTAKTWLQGEASRRSSRATSTKVWKWQHEQCPWSRVERGWFHLFI